MNGELLGMQLLSILREIESTGTRNYPADYQNGRVLVGMGLAKDALPYTPGEGYWLTLTDAGRLCAVSVREPRG